MKRISNDWHWGVCCGGKLPCPQLAGEYVSFSWVRHGIVLEPVELVEHSWICWNALAMIGSEESVVEDCYQVLNWHGEYVNFSWVWHGMVGNGCNWLNLVGLVETHWQWLAVRSLWWRTATKFSTGCWWICQFQLGLARNGWNMLKLVEHSWNSYNALELIGSKESVVEES